tara:strand:+ start:219 stop:479 length:261 start_codon:yes stop_codon:yes gene_type:complete
MLKADGFDKAILGKTFDTAVQEERLIYSLIKCIDVLVTRDKMTPDEAFEYMEFNVLNTYIGKSQPIFLFDTQYGDGICQKETTTDL